jgi:hypothetical protein
MSARGRYQVGGWLVSITRQAEVLSAMTTGPTRTTTRLVDGSSAGGLG